MWCSLPHRKCFVLQTLPTVAVATDVGGVADRSFFDRPREQLCNRRIQVAATSLVGRQYLV